MKWITRKDIKVDRVACPWLINRFIDPQAEFLFVEEKDLLEKSKQEGAIPFDAPKIEAIKLNHRGPRYTFEAILEDYTISDPALESDDLRRHRLNGIMLVNRGRISGRPIPSNVEFCQTQHAAVPLNERLAMALGSILEG